MADSTSENTSELTIQAAHDQAIQENADHDVPAETDAPEVDPLSAEADGVPTADVKVELDPDFDPGVGDVTVSVAGYPDLVLDADDTYLVSPQHAELLVASPAVRLAE